MKDNLNFRVINENKETTVVSKRSSRIGKEKKISRLAISSLICACLGILSSYCFLYSFVRLQPIYRVFKDTSITFFVVACLSGILSLVIIALKRTRLKGSMVAILSLFVCIIPPFMWIPVETSLARNKRGAVSSKMARIYNSITAYCTDHNGYLPDAENWCDLLIESDKSLSEDNFRYPPGKYGIFLFAFNKNLDGLRLSDIPEDVVLLFETDSQWNLAGGPELIEKRLKNRGEEGRFFVLLANGRVYQSIPSIRELFKEKMELHWKP